MNDYISDFHFGYERVFVIDKRAFPDLPMRKQTIIQNWNSRVQPQDTVYIPGDWIWDSSCQAEGMEMLQQQGIGGCMIIVCCMLEHMNFTPRTLAELPAYKKEQT